MVDGVAEGIHDVQVEGTFPVSYNRLFIDCQLIVRMGEQAQSDVESTADIKNIPSICS
jgi:hypothetical protein